MTASGVIAVERIHTVGRSRCVRVAEPSGYSVRAGQPPEKVIEASVFHHDDDYMLDAGLRGTHIRGIWEGTRRRRRMWRDTRNASSCDAYGPDAGGRQKCLCETAAIHRMLESLFSESSIHFPAEDVRVPITSIEVNLTYSRHCGH